MVIRKLRGRKKPVVVVPAAPAAPKPPSRRLELLVASRLLVDAIYRLDRLTPMDDTAIKSLPKAHRKLYREARMNVWTRQSELHVIVAGIEYNGWGE